MRCAALASILLLAAGCHDGSAGPPPDLGPPPVASPDRPGTADGIAPLNPRLMRRFPALAPVPPASAAMTDLGRMLFFDKRLSKGDDVSCNSCHVLDQYGVDHLARSLGHDRRVSDRNAPSVFHAAGQVAQFWDGRSPDVADQAGHPIVNPLEMAMQDGDHAVAVLRGIPGYLEAFRAAFPADAEPITFANLTAAIAAFEGGLITPGRWDRYLRGDRVALSADEIEGFRIFADVGCVECHTGEKLGGSMFKKAGRFRDWPDQADGGRWKVTGQESDRMVFKVPSLRNVAHTGPYFHDGSVATLEEAIEMMATYQLDAELEPREVQQIAAWMQSLTGALPARYIAAPTLP